MKELRKIVYRVGEKPPTQPKPEVPQHEISTEFQIESNGHALYHRPPKVNPIIKEKHSKVKILEVKKIMGSVNKKSMRFLFMKFLFCNKEQNSSTLEWVTAFNDLVTEKLARKTASSYLRDFTQAGICSATEKGRETFYKVCWAGELDSAYAQLVSFLSNRKKEREVDKGVARGVLVGGRKPQAPTQAQPTETITRVVVEVMGNISITFKVG